MSDPQLRLRTDAVEWQEIDGEVVALHLESSMYLAVNPSGRVLWRRLADGATRSELIDALRAEFGLPAGRAEADVDAFLAGLRENEVLAEPSPPRS